MVEGEVVADAEAPGSCVLIVDGERFHSLSDAATQITGSSRNGWLWWKNADGTPLKRGS